MIAQIFVGDLSNLIALLEGEVIYCVHCGREFALFPPALVVQHYADEHWERLTEVERKSSELWEGLEGEALVAAHMHFFVKLMNMRPDLRLRAIEAGAMTEARGEDGTIQ